LRIWGRAVGNYDFEQARSATRELFQNKTEQPDAVFVASDHMAFAVMDTLRFELKLRVPEDVSVVGFDNVPQAAWDSYRLTTVEQPIDPMIEATVSLLQNYLRDDQVPQSENVVVPGQLIVRSSARIKHEAVL
jgi:DNA-binding LacI/PurR family transcriptional regulator